MNIKDSTFLKNLRKSYANSFQMLVIISRTENIVPHKKYLINELITFVIIKQ